MIVGRLSKASRLRTATMDFRSATRLTIDELPWGGATVAASSSTHEHGAMRFLESRRGISVINENGLTLFHERQRRFTMIGS